MGLARRVVKDAMNMNLRLAGTHTLAFRCGCFFAHGEETGVACWRLCLQHTEARATIAEAFDEAGGQSVVVCKLQVVRPAASEATAARA